MNRLRSIIVIIFATTILTGCFGAAPIKPVASPDNAAAYGNITLPNNNVITQVTLYELGVVYAPPFKSPPQSHTYMNGNFFFENLKPGKYYLARFMSGNVVYHFNYSDMSKEEFLKEVPMVFKPGSVNYLGSYKVTGIEKNLFSSDTFEIKSSKKPEKKVILKHLIEAAKGTGWDQRFSKAMKKIR